MEPVSEKEVPSVYKRTEDFVSRHIMDSYVLVPVGKMASKINGMITLDDVASELWNLFMKGEQSDDDLVSYIMNEYSIDEASARLDVNEFLSEAVRNGSLAKSADN